MEIIKNEIRSITLERFAITRNALGKPTKVRAWLLVSTPTMAPSEMRLRVDFEYNDIPKPTEHLVGQLIVDWLSDRFR